MSDLPEFDRSRALSYLLVGAVVVVVGIAVLRGQSDGTDVVPGPGSGALAPKVVSRPLTVDVSGAVARPGVYEVPRGSRVIDAIERAGGATGNGLPGEINRAALLADGQQVVVPIERGAQDPMRSGFCSSDSIGCRARLRTAGR